MPIILNIETATEVCSVCISRDGHILSIEETSEQYTHATHLTLFINKCILNSNIALKDIDAVSISGGPGSYTALRIGTSTAKGICYALQKPLIAVDTLQSLALAASSLVEGNAFYCPMIDARRMEVYCAIYDHQHKLIKPPEALIINTNTFTGLLKDGNTIVLCGNGSEKCRPVLEQEHIVFSNVVCSSRHLVPIAEKAFRENIFCDMAYYTPYYLKSPNITIPKKVL